MTDAEKVTRIGTELNSGRGRIVLKDWRQRFSRERIPDAYGVVIACSDHRAGIGRKLDLIDGTPMMDGRRPRHARA